MTDVEHTARLLGKCPISGKAVDNTKTVSYKGQTVGFCCGNCPNNWAKLSDADKERLAADEFVPWFADGATHGFIAWTLRTPDGAFIGVSGLMTTEPPVGGPDPEFGCLLATHAHGLGYATEAGRAVIDDGWADSPNQASRRLVDKLGFRFDRAVFGDDATAYLVFVLDRPGLPFADAR